MSTDEGTYTCIAENRVGKVEASATLTVRGEFEVFERTFYECIVFSITVSYRLGIVCQDNWREEGIF